MNWIFASGDVILTWQKTDQDWGLGKYDAKNLEIINERWTSPIKITKKEGESILKYKTKLLNITIKRALVGNDLVETYVFTNTTNKKIAIAG